MTVINPVSPPGLHLERGLELVLSRVGQAERLVRKPLRPSDLAQVESEAWLHGCLRKGRADLPVSRTPMRLLPALQSGSSVCDGFAIEVSLPGGPVTRLEFGVHCFSALATQAAEELIDANVLKAGEKFTYHLEANGSPPPVPPSTAPPGIFNVTVKHAPLTHLEVPLRPLLEQATPVDILDDTEFPVFYTAAAHAKAEAAARKGGLLPKPVETGCIVNGSLATCPDSREFFLVAYDVLEVLDAEQTAFSLSYTDRSWQRLCQIMRARQAAHPEWACRILGQAHGHNFTPRDGKVCAECEKLPVCALSSVFISQSDEVWHSCVFARQPWALCHIFGLTARNEPVQQLHALKDGRLQPRGYYVIPQFDPAQWPARNLP